ncbi:tetratricopeptide repeat protein [Nonomuraea jiangxiensis]|uniref:Flp pilus assembly protein TadD, contains TPR repeats n=1 Tax=Nonomuraea jiangxiensis TaxID=633440 RepID=A0A1G8IKP1_9ACTN|nr:tetratricopeptide repeat protein [Nonomuraea jiangxiensis]SDI19347.1 Flp pilus assembly protein TadD, contains TPR repeats [Nonomuraea jiangxiensis]
MKVHQARDPLALGVHPGVLAESGGVPSYVPRDVDPQVCRHLLAGGFVLLAGDPAAGKTRTAYEGMRAALPGHDLFAPEPDLGKDAMAALVDRMVELPAAVLWLDDLDRFLLSGTVTSAQLVRLLDGPGHLAVIATIRQVAEERLIESAQGRDDVRGLAGHAAHVLTEAQRIPLPRLFSAAELERAVHVPDGRVADALKESGTYGIAEFLSAGPELREEYEHGRLSGHPRGVALVSAALDCRRAGYLSPLPMDLLEDLHDVQGAQPESLEEAWSWATLPRSTAAMLRPVPAGGAVEVSEYLADLHRPPQDAPVPDRAIATMLEYAAMNDALALADRLRAQGRHESAAHAYRHAIVLASAEHGDTHQDTLAIRDALAGTLRTLGRLAEAEAERRELLDIRRRQLGETHPHTLASRNNLALVLRELGRLEEAEAEHRTVLEFCKLTLGDDHPDTLTSRDNLASVVGERGRLEEAQAEHRAVLEARRVLLGDTHPHTLATRNNLALVLRALGHLTYAEAEYRAVLQARRRLFGEEHPDTLASRNNLARTHSELGWQAGAEAEHRSVLETRRRVLGEEHPDTLASWGNLAQLLGDMGRLEEAQVEHRAVLQVRRRVLGDEHPHTLINQSNLALVLHGLGRLEEAEAKHRAVLEARRRILGDEHPSTSASRGNLALTLRALGNLDEAESLELYAP